MRHRLSLLIIALMTTTTVVMGATIISHFPSAQAQDFSSPEQQALLVYQALPTLPKENQYKHRRRKKTVENNTLVSRMIRYHAYTKGRSPEYRLDWKITLADYLGLNDYMAEKTYPGAAFLKPNPFEADVATVRTFSAKQRNDLIQALVNVYDVEAKPAPSPVEETSTPSPAGATSSASNSKGSPPPEKELWRGPDWSTQPNGFEY